MNPEEFEDVLAQALIGVLASPWAVVVGRSGAANPNEVRVMAGPVVFTQAPGQEEANPSVRTLGIDEATGTLTATFHSAPQAPRTAFTGIYAQCRRACRALNGAREEFWALAGLEPGEQEHAEVPTRSMVATFTYEAQAGVGE